MAGLGAKRLRARAIHCLVNLDGRVGPAHGEAWRSCLKSGTTKCGIVMLLTAAMLSGCGHDVYSRADTTDAQYIADENACFAYAEQQPYAALGGENAYQQNIAKERNDVRACMIARGYKLAPKWPRGPYGESPTTGPDPAKAPLATRQ